MLKLNRAVFAVLIGLSSQAFAVEIDQSTPKATALSFAKALEAGDDAAARQLVTGTDSEKQVVDAWVDFTASVKKLRDASVKKFGEKADEVTGAGMNLDSSKALEDTEVKEEGDTAILTNTKQQGQGPMQLKKIDGKWMVNLSDTFKGATAAGQNIDQMQAMLKGWAEACKDTAEEIDKGQYPAPADANAALNVKMMAALKSVGPTTGPTTAPTTAQAPAK